MFGKFRGFQIRLELLAQMILPKQFIVSISCLSSLIWLYFQLAFPFINQNGCRSILDWILSYMWRVNLYPSCQYKSFGLWSNWFILVTCHSSVPLFLNNQLWLGIWDSLICLGFSCMLPPHHPTLESWVDADSTEAQAIWETDGYLSVNQYRLKKKGEYMLYSKLSNIY